MSELGILRTDPIKIELILKTIFGFCDASTLQNCRLVCTKWKDLSLKSWRDKAMLQLGPDPKLSFSEFLNLTNSEDDDPLLIKKYPFKQYSVEFQQCDSGDDVYWEQKRVAIAISNNRARSLQVIWEPSDFNEFNELLQILNTDSLEDLQVIWRTLDGHIPGSKEPLKCSKLKRLDLYTSSISIGLFHSWEYSLWPWLLKSFSKVEALSVAYGMQLRSGKATPDYSVCLAERLKLVKVVKALRKLGGEGVFPLKELFMIDVYTNQNEQEYEEGTIIDLLAECKFPLERLGIHMGWDGKDQFILPLLKTCKDTLHFLRASVNFNETFYSNRYQTEESTGRLRSDLKPLSNPDDNKIICMNELTEVQLINGLEWAMFFLEHLEVPQLETLIVEYDNKINPYRDDRFGLISVKLPKGKAYEKLETFIQEDVTIIPDGKMIKRFAKMMPNVTSLTIPLDKKGFPVICEYFKGLKKLHVLVGEGDYVEIDDEAFTGLSKEEMNEGGEVSSRRPNITDLEHLSDLWINGQRQLLREQVKLTEHSVIYGFLQLPKLFYLSVALREISEETKEKLESHVKGYVYLQTKFEPATDCFGVEIVSEDEDESSDMEVEDKEKNDKEPE